MDYLSPLDLGAIIAAVIAGGYGFACLIMAYWGDDNLDKPDWPDSSWF